MGPDPKPQYSVGRFHTDGAVVQPDTGRPELTNFLEVELRMPRIGLEKGKSSVGKFSHGMGKRSITRPEIRRGAMSQSSVERPEASSRNARSANSSSFPAFTPDAN
jgi:hypothetical protein